MKELSDQEIKQLGEQVGINFSEVDFEQFKMGLAEEYEHGTRDPETNVTNDDPILTAKIAWAHLKEMPDYYTQLRKMEHGDS